MPSPTFISAKLSELKKKKQYRELSQYDELVDFSSNDFLGLSKNKELLTSILDKSKAADFLGATGSRLLTGNSSKHEELELFLADFHGSENAILFNSGYNANLGLLSCLPQKGDTIILDEKAHSSIKDGAKLSFAKKLSFKHNNAKDLDKKLLKSEGEKYVVVESLYSMDGDFCDIENIISICEKHNAHLIVDEAHTTGLYNDGKGWCNAQKVGDKVFALIITFGKAIGNFGAAILCSEELKDYLINFSRSFIYTTALPSINLIGIECAFKHIRNNSHLILDLEKNIKTFNSLFGYDGDSHIKYIKLGDSDFARHRSKNLIQQGFDVRSILSPTVPKGDEGLRICLHSFNSEKEIERLHNSLRN